jgi:hypothetical protein
MLGYLRLGCAHFVLLLFSICEISNAKAQQPQLEFRAGASVSLHFFCSCVSGDQLKPTPKFKRIRSPVSLMPGSTPTRHDLTTDARACFAMPGLQRFTWSLVVMEDRKIGFSNLQQTPFTYIIVRTLSGPVASNLDRLTLD